MSIQLYFFILSDIKLSHATGNHLVSIYILNTVLQEGYRNNESI